jgi:hypothetical protein
MLKKAREKEGKGEREKRQIYPELPPWPLPLPLA